MADDLRVQMALEDLESEDPEARLAAIHTLGDAGEKSAVGRLAQALVDNEVEIRSAAGDALRKIGGLAVVQEVLALLRRDDLPDREQIAALGEQIIHDFARNVHDGLAAKLAAAVMQLTIIERFLERDPSRIPDEIKELKQLTTHASQEARNIITNLNH